MTHVPLLDELALIAGIGVVVSLVLARFRLPTVAGLLFAGALLGPSGLGLVRSIESIEALAEIGVVLLLFTIGLEFSLSRLRHIGKHVAFGGSIQVGMTTVVVLGIALALGLPLPRAIFYGFVFALSSTAIVLRSLTERRELDAPHGRFIVGVLIFQDLCVVPMLLIVPLLSDTGRSDGHPALEIGTALGKAALVVVLTLLIARKIVPRLFQWVASTRSREVFLLAVLTVCIGTAWLTSLAGLSLALGAFLGGMVVADTEYSHRAMGDMLPLRDTFTSVFFVSLGMLFDGRTLLEKPLVVLLLLAGFVLGKGFLATLAALAMRFPARVAWLAGVGLAQFGEFDFVLASLGKNVGLIDDKELKLLLAAGILSMFLTPMLLRKAPHVTAGEKLIRPLERLVGARGIDETTKEEEALAGHVVVVGFGVAGRLVAHSLNSCGIRFLVLELHAEAVREARADGLPVYYADATSEEALDHAGLRRARALVLLMNDPQAVERVITSAKRIAEGVPIVVRTHYRRDAATLVDLGAADVVVEEVEAGVEVVARVLRGLDTPRNVIDERVEEARALTQKSERAPTLPRVPLPESALRELKIETFLVRASSAAAGRTVASLDLRRKTRALVVAIRRDGELLDHPDPHETLRDGDVVFLVGAREAVSNAMALLERGNARADDRSVRG
jgi:CPA2 family monovalent cation:H+ antiporter-2